MLLDGYIRVSQVAGRSGPTFISPVSQREQIERWAAANGAVIGLVFEELDESGARSDRPMLLEAIRRVEMQESDGVIVAYLSRFGRSLIDALSAIKRITTAGGTFVSVQEGLDLSNDTGRLLLRFLFSIAEWERDRTRAFFADARERAVARGAYVGGLPLGYRRCGDGSLEPDPESAPIVVELFRRRVAGESVTNLQGWLVGEGERLGTYWRSAVDQVLRRRAYRGESRSGEFFNAQAHDPLVSEDTWQRAQTKGMRVPVTHSFEPALLRGILRCAGCQRPLELTRHHTGASVEYRAYWCSQKRRPRCHARAMIHDTVVEPYVEAIFWQELPRALRRGSTGIRRLEAELARREEELAAYRDNPRLPKTLGDSRFADGLAVRVRRVEESRRALAHARIEGDRQYLAEPDALARRWTQMSVNERRNAIAAVIDCVFVSRRLDRRQPFEERLHVYLRGRGPGPVPYERGDQTTAFNPAVLAAGVTLRPPKAEVDTQALRQDLEAFLEGQAFWPPFRQFQAHGRAGLYSRLRRTGGVRRWAADLGLECRPPNFITRTWSEERIREQLRPFMEGRAEWPSGREFSAAGLHALREALRWYGDADRWAREMGVKLPWPRKTVRRWSFDEMREAMRELARDSEVWPTQKQFREAGLGSLNYVTQRRPDLAEQLCTELDLLPRRKRANHPRRWKDENIQAALDQLLKGRDTWPGVDGFADAGLRGLREQLRRRGVMGEWAQRCGFEPPRQGARARRLTSPT